MRAAAIALALPFFGARDRLPVTHHETAALLASGVVLEAGGG